MHCSPGNREAELSGINTRLIRTTALCIFGAMSGLAGLVNTGRIGSAHPGGFEDMLLDGISGVVLGGTSLFGGERGISNTIIGLLIFAVLKNGLNLINLDIYLKTFVTGMILLLALIINVYSLKQAIRCGRRRVGPSKLIMRRVTMAEKMQAVMVHAYGDFRLEEVPKPQIGPGEVLIRVGGAGVCAADRKFYTHGPWKLPFPFITGHEVAGQVVELGDGAAEKFGLAIGNRVAVEPVIPCGTCWYCQHGDYQLCDDQQFLGVTIDGGWAEYTKLPSNVRIYKVPAHVPLTEAAMAEPVSCGVYAVEKAGIGLEDVVVVAGMGPIGMSALQVARLKSPCLLIALGRDDTILQIASELGAQVVLNVNKDNVPAEIRKLTDGRGCDLYIEASGNVDSINMGIDVLRKGGKLFVYGVYGKPATVEFDQVGEFKELTVQGGHLSPHSFPLAVQYIADGRVNAKRMVTHVFDLKDFVQAIEMKLKKEVKEPMIKATFDPSRGELD